MDLYRIVKKKNIKNAFSGEGAARYPGRWNSLGSKMIYTADSRSLACMELMVHGVNALHAYSVFKITIDEDHLRRLSIDDLPDDWYSEPPKDITKEIGDSWLASDESIGLLVPSVVIPQQENCLLNPMYSGFTDNIEISHPENFIFDTRL